MKKCLHVSTNMLSIGSVILEFVSLEEIFEIDILASLN